LKTIAFFINDISNTGGTQKVVSLLAKGLVESGGYKVIIYSLNIAKSDRLREEFKGMKIISLNSKFNTLGLVYSIAKINFLNIRFKVDTLIGIGVYLSIFLPLFFNVRTIAAEHNSYSIVSNLTHKCRNISYKYINYIVSLTEHDLNYYKNINKNSIVIPNPIDISVQKEKNNFRENKIVAVGTLTKRKGFDRLLQLWTSVEPHCDFFLDIYGDGEESEKLKAMSNQLGHKRVRFMGNVNKIEDYLVTSKLFVMTSYIEGFPMVLLEAMSCGLPCIAYDIKTGPAEIIANGINGYLIPDGNQSEFINKMKKLVDDELKIKGMRFNAIKSVGKFQLKQIIEKWKEIL